MIVPVTCTLSSANCSLVFPIISSGRTLCSIHCSIFYNSVWLSRKNSSMFFSGSLVISPLKAFPSDSQNWSCSSTLISRWGQRQHRESAVYALLEDSSDKDSLSEPSQSNKDATIDMKLPRRRLLVQFTCNQCGERTDRLVNRLAYERGLVFVQCAGCLRHHKLVDNLGLIVEYDLREDISVDERVNEV